MEKFNKTILIVDDDPDFLLQNKMKVESFGFNTILAESQREAEKLIETIKPDLAILDLMMESDDSGFILAFKLKKKYPDVPVIIVTAVTAETGMMFSTTSEEERRWIKADTYLDKGIRSDQLKKEIFKLLNINI